MSERIEGTEQGERDERKSAQEGEKTGGGKGEGKNGKSRKVGGL